LQADIVDISSGEEQARQEDPSPEAPKNPVTAINLLVNLQDPILETPENLATTVNTLVNLQELQEPIIGYQSFSRKGASAGADYHLIGY
jgi:hypothetical protein